MRCVPFVAKAARAFCFRGGFHATCLRLAANATVGNQRKQPAPRQRDLLSGAGCMGAISCADPGDSRCASDADRVDLLAYLRASTTPCCREQFTQFDGRTDVYESQGCSRGIVSLNRSSRSTNRSRELQRAPVRGCAGLRLRLPISIERRPRSHISGKPVIALRTSSSIFVRCLL